MAWSGNPDIPLSIHNHWAVRRMDISSHRRPSSEGQTRLLSSLRFLYKY